MSLALSNKKSESNISFNSKSLVSLDSQTVVAGGQYSVPEIEVGFKCDYIKLLVNVSTSDTDLTTDEFKSVTAVYKIEYIEDEEKNISNIRTVCFTPKFQHEVDNKDTYTIIELPAKKITKINMTVYNNEETDISIDVARIYYSRLLDEETVKEIAGTGGGDVPVSNILTLYNINNEYTIDGYNKSLILDLVVPDDILEQYGIKTTDAWGVTTGYLNIILDITSKSAGVTYSVTKEDTKRVLNGTEWTIKNSKITIKSTESNYAAVDGLISVIARIQDNQQLYGECNVEIKNSEVKDIYIKSISSEDGNLHTGSDVKIDIGFLPENSYGAITGSFILQSYDEKGKANNVNGSNNYTKINGTLGNNFTLRGVSEGRVSLYLGNDYVNKTFYFNVIDDTTETFELVSDSGENTISTGKGQLKYRLKNDLSLFKPVEFSIVSLDTGEVGLNADKNNGIATITAYEDGQVKLIAKSNNNKETSTIINISGQYPEDVTFNSSDGTYKVNVGSQLLIDIEPTNNCRSDYDRYNHEISKIDAGVDCSIQSLNYGKTAKIIGKAVGSFSLNVLRTKDSKLLNSKVIEVINSASISIPLPDENCYWVLVKRKDVDYPVLCYIDNASSAEKFIYKSSSSSIHTDNKFTKSYQYILKDFAWEKRGEWDYESTALLSSNIMLIYDSCFDIYDASGNLIINKTPSWEDVNLAKLVNKLKN